VRSWASKALINKKEKAVEPLIKGLNDENGNVRENCVLLLIKIGDEKALEPLIKHLEANTAIQPEIQENKT
jgi:HEAT repeat protein